MGSDTAPSLWRSATFVSIASGCSAASGMAVAAGLAYYFGASHLTDALFMAQTIPMLLSKRLQIASLSRLLLPLAYTSQAVSSPDLIMPFIGQILGKLVLLISLIVICIIGLIPWGIRILAPGFDPVTQAQTALLAQVLLPTLVLSFICETLTVALHGRGAFKSASWVDILVVWMNPILVWVFAGRWGIWAAVLGIWGWQLARTVGLLIVAVRLGLVIQYRFSFWDAQIRALGKTLAPLMIKSFTGEFHVIVIRLLASFLPTGLFSILSYAERFSNGINQFLVSPVSSVVYPRLVDSAHAPAEFLQKLWKGIHAINFIIFPLGCIGLYLAPTAIELLFQRGGFGASDTLMASNVLRLLLIGLFFQGYANCFLKGLYALRRTGEITKGILLHQAAVSLIALALFKLFHVYGLALALGLAPLLSGIFYAESIQRLFQKQFVWLPPYAQPMHKGLLSLGLLVTWLGFGLLLSLVPWQVIGWGIVALLLYLVSSWLLKMDESLDFCSAWRR